MHGYFNNQERDVSQAPTRRRFIDPDLLPDPPRQSRARKSKSGWKPSRRAQWRKQIKRTLNVCYGYPLPDDDAGRECFALLCHAAFAELSPNEKARVITNTAAMWADWMAKPELAALIDDVTNRPRRELNRKKIGIELGLTQEVRMRDDVKAYAIWPVMFGHDDWKRWKAKTARERAARNRAKKRQAKPPTKTAQAITFLQRVLADGPQPVDRIMRLAVGAGLEKPNATRRCYALRAACEALGIVPHKMSVDGGWWWGLPETQNTAQVIDISEGAVVSPGRSETPSFSEGAVLRSPTSLGGLSERRDQKPDRVSDDDQGWPVDAPDARVARSARPEFAARLCDTGRFTISVPVEFRAKMRSACIVAASLCFPRTAVGALSAGGRR